MKHQPIARPRAARVFRHSLSLAVTLVAALCLKPAHAQSTSTFGTTSVTTTTASSGLTGDFKRASRFSLAEGGTLKQLCAYLDGNGGATGMQYVQFALYTDAGGKPAAKVADSTAWALTNGAAAQWICLASNYLAPIPAGQYWIAILSSGPSGVIRTHTTGSAQNWYGNADSFSDGPADLFGTGNAGTGTLAAYAQYYPQSELSTAGRTTIGTLASQGMTPNFKRGSSFVMPERGKFWGMAAYIDGRGSANFDDQQVYRAILYKDAGGVPGEKIFESGENYVRATRAPTWRVDVTSAGAAPTLDPGRYWIVLHSGGLAASPETGGVARYFYNHTGNWYGNDDMFSDGASSPFGVGTAKSDAISAYIYYRPGIVTAGQLGRADIATTPSRALDHDVIRWSFFHMEDGNATLTGLHAYLDGLGATSGSQAVRMVMYRLDTGGRDENGNEATEYTRIAQSDPIIITAGMQPRWVNFAVPAVALYYTDFYIIGIQSGGPASVVRDYGDSRPGYNWSSRVDTFADGAAETFDGDDPAIKSGTVTLSVYASYSLPPP